MLVPLAAVASGYILFDEPRHTWPPIVTVDQLEGSILTGMSCGGCIVTLTQHFRAYPVIRRDIDFPFMVNDPLFLFPLY